MVKIVIKSGCFGAKSVENMGKRPFLTGHSERAIGPTSLIQTRNLWLFHGQHSDKQQEPRVQSHSPPIFDQKSLCFWEIGVMSQPRQTDGVSTSGTHVHLDQR